MPASSEMICVLGSTGQVATALKETGRSGLTFLGRDQADFTKPDQVVACLEKLAPKFVVNAAAYTAVDLAEKERDLAFQVNAHSVGRIARYCAEHRVPLVHYSTDYVYDGTGTSPWKESDPIRPQNAYGESKAEGEKAVRESGAPHLILRTSWVYHSTGKNFVQTMLRLGAERETLSVVGDQVGSPTSARAIAEATLKLIDSGKSEWGTYNLAGSGFTSWHGFALKIFELAREMGFPLKVGEVKDIPSSAYPTPAKRPLNSRLNQEKLLSAFGVQLPPWERSLRDCLAAIHEGKKP